MAIGKNFATLLCVLLAALFLVADGASVAGPSVAGAQWLASEHKKLFGDRNLGYMNGGSGNAGAFNGLGNSASTSGNFNTGACVCYARRGMSLMALASK